MKIARLSIKNFLGIIEAEIKPGHITTLAGANRQGKSSVLKALQAAFKGTTPQEIHKGTERAEIIVELEDLIVTRVQTLKTAAVTVKTKEGFTRNAPQKFLDGLLGGFAFNPLAFLLADTKGRRDFLLRAMAVNVTRDQIVEAAGGLDVPVRDEGPALEQYAEAQRVFYQTRTDTNRRLKQKQGAVSETASKIPEGFKPDDTLEEKKKTVSARLDGLGTRVATLQAEKKAADKAQETRTKLEERIRKNTGILDQAKLTLAEEKVPDIASLLVRVEDLRLELRKAEEALQAGRAIIANIDRLKSDVANMERDIRQDQETLDELPGVFDMTKITEAQGEADGLRQELEANEKMSALMHTYDELRILKDEAAALEEESDRLTALVEKFGKELPAKALAEAKLPIEGLALDGERIAVNGIAIDDLATSEQIGITLSIARALSKELPLICIDGVERLDEESFAEFTRQAEADGFQYFVTRVGVPKAGEIEVAGGKVKSA